MEIINNIFKILKKHNLSISFCESASGGALSNLMASIEGSSEVFKGAIVSYSNSVKINLVKIPKNVIKENGAVSKITAEYMSKNTNSLLGSDICVSITGNAGINTMENKETCLYYVGITIVDKTYVYEVKQEFKERNFNRINISLKALEILYDLLIECGI